MIALLGFVCFFSCVEGLMGPGVMNHRFETMEKCEAAKKKIEDMVGPLPGIDVKLECEQEEDVT